MVKALDLSSNGQMSAWDRTPPALNYITIFLRVLFDVIYLFALLNKAIAC